MQLTAFFSHTIKPSIPGKYRCRKQGSAFACDRIFDGSVWLSPADNKTVSPIQDMDWQGVVPGSIKLTEYSAAERKKIAP